LSPKLGSCIGTQGLVTWGKMVSTYPHMTSPQIDPNPKLSNLKKCKLDVLLHLLRIWTVL